MLQYILNTPSFMHHYGLYKFFDIEKWPETCWQTVQYAEKMKQNVASLLNIDRALLECRNFKENYYVDFNTLTIHQKIRVDEEKILSDAKFAKETKRLDKELTKNYYLSIRQVLQYYATQIMRHYFQSDIWILSTLKSYCGKIIITDQRFINEYNRAKERGTFVIHITRPNTQTGAHDSEAQVEELLSKKMYDVLIENDKDLKHLFNVCKNLCKKLNY